MRALAVSGDGSVLYVGGNFDAVDGVPVTNFAAISTVDGSLIPGFQHKFTTGVHVINVTPSLVYVGGAFTEGRRRDARPPRRDRPATGALDPTWNPTANNTVRSFALAPDGTTIFIGGIFTQMNGVSRQSVARVEHDNGPARPLGDPGRRHRAAPDRLGASAYRRTVCTPASAMARTTRPRSGSTTASSGARCGASAPSGTLRAWRCRTTAPGSSWAATSAPAALQQTVCGQPLHGLMSVNPVNGVAYCDWFPAITPFGSNFKGAWCMLSTGTKLYVGGLIDAINGVTHVGLARFPL